MRVHLDNVPAMQLYSCSQLLLYSCSIAVRHMAALDPPNKEVRSGAAGCMTALKSCQEGGIQSCGMRDGDRSPLERGGWVRLVVCL
jgi:hypothetical protein